MAQAVVLLATAPKSNTRLRGHRRGYGRRPGGEDRGFSPASPERPRRLRTGFEREQGYLYPHNFPNHWVKQQYLPDPIKDKKYYEYGPNKTEQAARAYWEKIKQS